MAPFIGHAPLSLLNAAYGSLFIGSGPGNVIRLAGLAYFIGCFGITLCFNVPVNEAQAGMDVAAEPTSDDWTGAVLADTTGGFEVNGAQILLSDRKRQPPHMLTGQYRAKGFAFLEDKIKEGRDTGGMALVRLDQDAPGAGQFGNRTDHPDQIGLGIA